MSKYSEYVYYDETSPTFLRHAKDKMSGKGYRVQVAAKDGVAGCIDSQGYGAVKIIGRAVKIHKIVLSLFGTEVDSRQQVDHKDGVRSNNNISNLRVVSSAVNSRNKKSRATNTSGVTGVTFTNNGIGNYYCSAKWCEMSSNIMTKHFSIAKLGIMVAFRDAVIYRNKMIEELNELGAGYTERHGKEPTCNK